MTYKSHKYGQLGSPMANADESLLEGSRRTGKAEFHMNGRNFVRLGKFVAPSFDLARDRTLIRLADGGHAPDEIARRVCGSVPDVTIRLVELCLGPLGRIRPAADQPRISGPRMAPDRQKPILSLAARALGDTLQRLGDRLYLDGRETQLQQVVREARNRGVRIRYPRIDPMDEAWRAGPSREDAGRTREQGNAFTTPWDVHQ